MHTYTCSDAVIYSLNVILLTVLLGEIDHKTKSAPGVTQGFVTYQLASIKHCHAYLSYMLVYVLIQTACTHIQTYVHVVHGGGGGGRVQRPLFRQLKNLKYARLPHSFRILHEFLKICSFYIKPQK